MEQKEVKIFLVSFLKDVGLLPADDGAPTGGDGGEQPKSNEDIEKGGGGGGVEGGGTDAAEGGSGGGASATTPVNTATAATGGGEDLVDALPEELPPAGASMSGTPLTTRPPPQTESHMPKEETDSIAAGGGSVAAGSAANADVGFIEVEEEKVCLAGKVLVSFTYMPAANKVNLKVIRTGDLPPVERGGSERIQIHLCVLPQRKQRFRTKSQTSIQGVFNQIFTFEHMTKDLLEKCAIRLRVYGVQRLSKKLMGEVKIPLTKIDLTSPLADGDIWMNLAPKGELVSVQCFCCCCCCCFWIE